MPPHSYLLHIHSALVSTEGDAAKIVRNASLFGATAFTPDPDLEELQQKSSSPYFPLSSTPTRPSHGSRTNTHPELHWSPPSFPSRELRTTTSASNWSPVPSPTVTTPAIHSASRASQPSRKRPTRFRHPCLWSATSTSARQCFPNQYITSCPSGCPSGLLINNSCWHTLATLSLTRCATLYPSVLTPLLPSDHQIWTAVAAPTFISPCAVPSPATIPSRYRTTSPSHWILANSITRWMP